MPARPAWLVVLAVFLLCAPARVYAQSGAGDVVYVPTPQSVVDRMLAMARVDSNDLVMDLGSGDGRIVITAAKQYGARGLGLDLDRSLVGTATRNAAGAGVAGKAQFLRQNFFQFDVSAATVVTTYLGPGLMVKLRPKLLRELKPGVRIVSHDYHFGDWAPDEAVTLKVPEKKVGTPGLAYVYLWTVPASVHGIWRIEVEGAGGAEPYELALVQQYQFIEGLLRLDGKLLQLADPQLAGSGIRFGVSADAGATYEFSGRASGAEMAGELTISRSESRETRPWKATRVSPVRQLE